MGTAGSTNRRHQYPQQTYQPYTYEPNVRPADPYAVSRNVSEHTPRIVVQGPTCADQRDRYEVQQQPSMCTQQQTYSPSRQQLQTPATSRTAFVCEHASGLPAQQATQTTPPPPPIRNPIESCTCADCRLKNEALSAYGASSTAAQVTYVAQNQCPPSTSVAARTAALANMSTSCTGCTASGMQPSTPPMSNQMGYTAQQYLEADRVVSTNTCSAPNCRGHTVDACLEQPLSMSSNQRNSNFGLRSMGRKQKPSPSKQRIMQTQTSPSCYDGMSHSGAAQSDVVSVFHQECLEAHNRYRARHQNCPPLSLSSELSQYAQQWAKHLASTGRLEHRQVHTYGENLYTSRGMAVNGSTVVQSWYDEIRYYDFSKPNYKPGTGHFTQVVWRDSRQLGVGVVTKGDTTYVVCNYNPPGNIIGSFDCMVPQLK